MKLRPPVSVRLDDTNSEVARRNHEERINELQALPAMGLVVIADVSLASGVETPIAHKLGRRPLWHSCSSPRGAVSTGRIEEIRNTNNRHDQVIVLKATGWGATIVVDLAVL